MIHIEIKNLPQLRHAFGQAPNLMRREFKTALTKSAITVQRQSMINAPVDTGRLRGSHLFTVTGNDLSMRAEVYPTAEYGIFVHEGTRFMKGRPFLRKAAESSVREIDDFFTTATQNALNRIGRMT